MEASAGAQHLQDAPAPEGILYLSTDYGLNWKDISSGLPAGTAPFNLGGGNNGEIFMGTSSGLFRMGYGPVMTAWIKELFPEAPVTGLFSGQSGPYAISQGSGFFQHIPGTTLWTPLTSELTEKMINTMLETSEGILLAGSERGIYRSGNRGISWQSTDALNSVWTLTESAGVLISGSGNGIQRSTDGGLHWEHVEGIDGPVFLSSRFNNGFLIVMEGSPDAEGEKMDEVYISSDGTNWQRLWETPPPALRRINDVEVAGPFLFISSEKGVYRSSDKGKNWDLIRKAPPGENNFMRLVVAKNLIFLLKFGNGGC